MSVPRQEGESREERYRARDTRFSRLYGAHLWHLAVLAALLAGTAYVVGLLLDDPALLRIAIWFVGAAVVWDLVLGPLVGLGDGVLRRLLGRARTSGVRPLNYVRFPAAISLLLLVMWAPLVLQRSEGVYGAKSGLAQDPYLGRWLAVTAGLGLLSAVAFVVAVLRARRR